VETPLVVCCPKRKSAVPSANLLSQAQIADCVRHVRACMRSSTCRVRERQSAGFPPQQSIQVVRDNVHVRGEHGVAASDAQVGPCLVEQSLVADGARQLEETLQVLHGVREVALLVVQHAQRAARLGLRLWLARRLRQLQEALQEGQRGRAILQPQMHARQRKASGALALGVLGALAQLQELLVVRGRLLEVVVVLG
jgi:hypothetical protein